MGPALVNIFRAHRLLRKFFLNRPLKKKETSIRPSEYIHIYILTLVDDLTTSQRSDELWQARRERLDTNGGKFLNLQILYAITNCS